MLGMNIEPCNIAYNDTVYEKKCTRKFASLDLNDDLDVVSSDFDFCSEDAGEPLYLLRTSQRNV